MSFKFPTSGTTASTPTVGSTFGVGTKVWEWNGTVFNLFAAWIDWCNRHDRLHW